MFKESAIVWIVPTLAVAIAISPWVVLPWTVLMLFLALSARGTARFAAYAVDGQVIAWRSGWLSRRWTLARISKAQSVRLECSPFDRRAGMAAVAIDTAGAGLTAFRLRIPYLADSTARALCAHLAARLDTETPPADTAGVALAGPVSAS
jgi:membrane protein YdbS with pleckstrin-like domain